MDRSPHWLLAFLLTLLAGCQIHHPQLGPNVEQLDREREQLDRFVASQPPLPDNEDPSAREACTRQVEASPAPNNASAWTPSAMDAAVRECVETRQPN